VDPRGLVLTERAGGLACGRANLHGEGRRG
jgi:hypothetical protein